MGEGLKRARAAARATQKQAMSFDPEKVKRYECGLEPAPEPYPSMYAESDGDYVRAADYDQLLALYRAYRDEAVRNLEMAKNNQMVPKQQ